MKHLPQRVAALLLAAVMSLTLTGCMFRSSVEDLFTLPREGDLYMAGLYDRRGSEECYCILTTAPNASMRPIHDRMPLILTGEQRQRWLADADAATEILTVVPPELTRASAEAQISLW